MTATLQPKREWTAEAFIEADQHDFGPLWRYELVDGRIIGHAAPSPEHAAIVAGLITALARALASAGSPCRPEAGSAATPRTGQRNTARIPDAMVRCGEHPRVMFEVVSPTELRNRRARDRKRQHLQAVEGVHEIVELFQDDYAAHVYRLVPGERSAWTFDAMLGGNRSIELTSLGIEISLEDIYMYAALPNPPEEE